MDLKRTKAAVTKRDTSRASFANDVKWRLSKSRSLEELKELLDRHGDQIVTLLEKVADVIADRDLAAGKAAMISGVLEAMETAADFLENTE